MAWSKHPKNPYKIQIKGHSWDVFVFSDKAYEKKHGNDSHGVTYPYDRQIVFPVSSLIPEVVIHELYHALIEGCEITSTKKEEEDMEEIFAELAAKYHFQLGSWANDIIRYFLYSEKKE